ncbi:hypothetical protein [Streptomyces sp. NPDC054865]
MSDAQGQMTSSLWALRAPLAQRTEAVVMVRCLIVGEGKFGSVHLADLLSEPPDDLNADIAMVSDPML